MDHDHTKRTVKIDPFVGNDHVEGEARGGGGLSNVEKLRGYYDEARNRLKNYLAMGSGSSSPRNQDDCGGGGGGDGVGGVMFQQRPAHIRLEGKQVMGGEEFTDISYSDLGFIITPQSKKLTLNNNYQGSVDSANSANNCSQCSPALSSTSTENTDLDVDNECDVVSSTVAGGSGSIITNNKNNNNNNNNNNSSSSTSVTSSSSLSSSTPNINFTNNCNNSNTIRPLQHRGSHGSFTLSQPPGSAKRRLAHVQDKNLDDLRLEEVTT